MSDASVVAVVELKLLLRTITEGRRLMQRDHVGASWLPARVAQLRRSERALQYAVRLVLDLDKTGSAP